jgi:hypothetical protein
MIAQLSKSAAAVALALAALLCAGTAAAATPPTPKGFKACGVHQLSTARVVIFVRSGFSCKTAYTVAASLAAKPVQNGFQYPSNKEQTSAKVRCNGLYTVGQPPTMVTCSPLDSKAPVLIAYFKK